MRLIDADKLRADVISWEKDYNGFSDTYDKARIIDAIDEQPTVKPKTGMKDYVVESDFIYKGYRCVVIFGRRGFRCGYVGVDANNPLYKQDYYSGRLDIKKSELYGKPIGKRGALTLLSFTFDTDEQVTLAQYFDVHGSLTYSNNNPKYPVESELWWLGFDCGHCDDGIDGDLVREYWGEELDFPRLYDEYPVRSKEYVERECKSLVDQIIDLVGERGENGGIDMGIYVKGMSMDNGLYQIENGKIFKYSSKGKPTKQYDVVEVRTPHGDLIDRDKLRIPPEEMLSKTIVSVATPIIEAEGE